MKDNEVIAIESENTAFKSSLLISVDQCHNL